MTFDQGEYYVGDPVLIFDSEDLRELFKEIISPQGLQSGKKDLIAAKQTTSFIPVIESYFVAKLPHYSGTLFDQHNNGWGFEWGTFGCVPWEWAKHNGGYKSHKVIFTEPFDCSCAEGSVTIGHLHFTLNPK